MEEILIDTKILDYAVASLGMSLIGLSFVYIFGRLTGIIDYWVHKHAFIAIPLMATFSIIYVLGFRPDLNNIFQIIYIIFLYFSIAIVIYTTFGMRLFDRMDNLLDKYVGKDKNKIYRKRTKK